MFTKDIFCTQKNDMFRANGKYKVPSFWFAFVIYGVIQEDSNKLKKETKQIWAHYIKKCAKKTVNIYVYDFCMYELLVTCEL